MLGGNSNRFDNTSFLFFKHLKITLLLTLLLVMILCKNNAGERVNPQKIAKEFNNRVGKGKCFYQPCLGNRECMCFFAPADENRNPIPESRDLGIMLYDIFDLNSIEPLDTGEKTGSVNVTYYHPFMINGHISVPVYGSPEVFSTKGV